MTVATANSDNSGAMDVSERGDTSIFCWDLDGVLLLVQALPHRPELLDVEVRGVTCLLVLPSLVSAEELAR